MKIIITKETVCNKESRKKLIAQLYSALHSFLGENEKLIIEVDPKVELASVCSALRSFAGIIDMASDAIAGPPSNDEDDDDTEPDDADYWKK